MSRNSPISTTTDCYLNSQTFLVLSFTIQISSSSLILNELDGLLFITKNIYSHSVNFGYTKFKNGLQ